MEYERGCGDCFYKKESVCTWGIRGDPSPILEKIKKIEAAVEELNKKTPPWHSPFIFKSTGEGYLAHSISSSRPYVNCTGYMAK